MSKEAMKQALEALEYLKLPLAKGWDAGTQQKLRDETITALREALAEQPSQQQEPVGKAHLCDRCSTPFDGEDECPECGHGSATKKQVYLAPQPAPVQQEPDVWRVRLPRWTDPGIWNQMPKTQDQQADLDYWKSQDGAVIEYAVVISELPSPQPAQQEPVAWPIETNNQVEALAKHCGWDNRRYMTPADYQIWCDRMRQFARLSTPQPPAQPLTDELPALPEGKGVVRGPVAAFSQPECGTLVDFDCEGPLSHDPGDGEELFTADQLLEYATAAIKAARGIKDNT